MLSLREVTVPGFEQVCAFDNQVANLKGFVAIHSTARGPAAGGCRFKPYLRTDHALDDALRLARGMSLKNALAELPLGGGKAVVVAPIECHRATLFEAFGEVVERLGGQYLTAEDVGTVVSDMQIVQRRTKYVSGILGGDPSPWTALGVCLSLEEAVRLRLGAHDVRGITVAVQGVGHVGLELCRLLSRAGATLIVADTNDAAVRRAAEEFGALTHSAKDIHSATCDVFAPCALGGALSERNICELRAAIVCGAANNQLVTDTDGDELRKRGILYVPDFVANAGGIISVAAEYLGWSPDEVGTRVAAIGPRAARICKLAEEENCATNRVADRMAEDGIRLDHNCAGRNEPASCLV